MQDISYFLGSVNKISLLAFIGVFIFLIYEIHLLKKESQRKKIPSVPNFDPNIKIVPASGQTIKEDHSAPSSKPVNKILIVILSLLLVVFGAMTAISIFASKNKHNLNAQSKIIIQTVNSKGIKFFDLQWNNLSDKDLKALKPFDRIIIGVETVPEADIDRARIRVNESNWKIEHITTKFNKQYNVFYVGYQIASNEAKLKVDGQLYSKEDGWLGD